MAHSGSREEKNTANTFIRNVLKRTKTCGHVERDVQKIIHIHIYIFRALSSQGRTKYILHGVFWFATTRTKKNYYSYRVKIP